MMSLTFGLFTQVSGSGPLGPLVVLNGTPQVSVASETSVQLSGLVLFCGKLCIQAKQNILLFCYASFLQKNDSIFSRRQHCCGCHHNFLCLNLLGVQNVR